MGTGTDGSPALLFSQHTPACPSHFLQPLPGPSKTAAGLLECELCAGARPQQIALWPSAGEETEGGPSAVSSERASCLSSEQGTCAALPSEVAVPRRVTNYLGLSGTSLVLPLKAPNLRKSHSSGQMKLGGHPVPRPLLFIKRPEIKNLVPP